MKKLLLLASMVSLAWLSLGPACLGDTLRHRQRDEVLHGYAVGEAEGIRIIVHTEEKGVLELNLAEWEVSADRLGRNNKVIILTIDGEMIFEIETQAAEQAIEAAAKEGPLFILLEMDTPGGRTDLVQRICGRIIGTGSCEVVAFVKGGPNGGAISAGAAVALACDKIYMAHNTSIGAATVITLSEKGPTDLNRRFGEAVGEKFSSAWQAYLASLAEQNRRPGLLARAMIDKDIEVIEVSEAERKLFIEPVNRRPQQRLVRTWSQKGSLLTLTAVEAVKCGIGDGIVDSRAELLRELDAAGAEIVINSDVQQAREELRRARGQLDRIRKSIDLKIKQSGHPQPKPKVLKILRSARAEFKTLINLAKKYPDLGLDIRILEDELNTIEAEYQQVKMDSRRR
jgi:membrane-bound ClpP family serine protease